MKNLIKLMFIVGIVLCSPLLFVGCGDNLVLVTDVELYNNEVYASLNESFDLGYKVYPNNATNKKVTFWSTDENVAVVDQQGKVTVKDYGEASIIIRSVDGGYEDYCKVVTKVDPDEIRWDMSNDRWKSVSGKPYSATTTIALNQVMKLKVEYLLDGQVSELVTNRDVVFSSSNPNNIKVINENEGIIEADYDGLIDDEQAYSDITATLTTDSGELKIVCRVYINRDSSLSNLSLHYKDGNEEVLKRKDGGDVINLTSGGISINFYAYLTDDTGNIKQDYEMNIECSDENLFSVLNTTNNDGIYEFTLKPSQTNEGVAALYIKTTCSDENGIVIKTSVNIVVQAQIESAHASATKRRNYQDTEQEVLYLGEEFSISLDFYDAGGNKIDGATRDINFDSFDNNLLQYVTYYGNNKFKVSSLPSNVNEVFTISGYVYSEDNQTSDTIHFTYNFQIRNSLESIIVSKTEKGGDGSLPLKGLKAITMNVCREQNPDIDKCVTLYAYSTGYDYSKSQSVDVNVKNNDFVKVGKSGNKFIIQAVIPGVTTLVFYASDGITTIEYELTVYIVDNDYEIKFYENFNNGVYENEITQIQTTENSLKIYVDITSENHQVNCPSSISLTVLNADETLDANLVEKFDSTHKVVYRYIELDTSKLNAFDITSVQLYCSEYNIYNSITIKKR